MRFRHLCCFVFVLAAASGSVRAAGGVQGAVPLEPMKPLPGSPGYKADTKKPVQAQENLRAIVFLENDSGAYPKSRVGEKVQVRQEGYQFRPAIIAVQTGTQATFPNGDDEFHNVFSYSKTKRFDLGRFRKDEASPVVSFDKPGLVKVYCEIHKHMRCLVLVLDTPWFTTTDAQGRFTLKGVPAGSYKLKAMLPSERVLEMPVTIVEGKIVTAALTR